MGKIDSSTKATTKYAGATIEYSGYNGVGGKYGHEYIKIKGKSSKFFMVKAFAYQAGTAKITYKFGVDPAACAREKARIKKEKKTKHDAKAALKKSLNEKEYKKAKADLQKSASSCGGARGNAKSAAAELKKAEARKAKSANELKSCTAAESKQAAKVAKMKPGIT